MSYSDVMELPHLRWRIALEPYGSAIGERRSLSIDGFANAEGTAVMPIEQSSLTSTVLISQWLTCAKHTKQGVVEALRALDVV
jgi:hypothetical protein